MAMSFEDFQQEWKDSGEDLSEHVVDTAWRRYQQVQADDFVLHPEAEEPCLEQLEASFEPILSSSLMLTNHKFVSLPASSIPWTATGVLVHEDQPVSVFTTGRTWRSKLLDLYLTPKFNLWFRIGVNGSIFNSTHDTKTFMCIEGQEGEELYIANQFPGSFSDKEGGRVGSKLSAYDKAKGAFQILIIEWQAGLSIHSDIKEAFRKLLHPQGEEKPIFDPYGLMSIGLDRLGSEYIINQFPRGWTLLWFLGQNQIFCQEQDQEALFDEECKLRQPLEPVPESESLTPIEPTTTLPRIRCVPSHNVGILQKDLKPPIPLTAQMTTTWSWMFIDLPSRLREDTSFTHDYISVAFEFENGRDITYTWSWELPVGFGYWCPLRDWCDREYHVVLRTGTKQLDQWLDERRNLYEDYVEYINAGDVSKAVPRQIVKVWLIAGNRWQRHRGEMLIKKIRLFDAGGDGDVITVL